MKRVAKVAISIPNDVYHWVEAERAKLDVTRSQLMTRLLRGEMYRQELEERAKRYEEAYRKFPETEEERAWIEESSRQYFEATAEWDEEERAAPPKGSAA